MTSRNKLGQIMQWLKTTSMSEFRYPERLAEYE